MLPQFRLRLPPPLSLADTPCDALTASCAQRSISYITYAVQHRFGELIMLLLFPGESSASLDTHSVDCARFGFELNSQALVATGSKLTLDSVLAICYDCCCSALLFQTTSICASIPISMSTLPYETLTSVKTIDLQCCWST